MAPVTIHDELLERDTELRAVTGLVDAALERDGRALALVGPAGIGKTRLVEAGVTAARDRGLETVVVRGSRLERELAYLGIRQLFAPLVRAHPELLVDVDPAAAAFFSRQATPPEADPGGALQALYWTIADLAEQVSLLVVFDDAHWIDPPSLRFLSFLARRLAGLPLSVLIGTRPPEGRASREALATLLADQALEQLRPSPLTNDGVARLVESRFGVAPAGGFTDACVRAAGGNPFLTHELAASLQRADVSPDDAGARAVASGGADASATILQRVRDLPDGALELARSVAVLGSKADTHTASRLAGLLGDDVATAADLLWRAGILTDARPLEFVHPLVRQAFYDDIGTGDRGRRHRRAAGLLAELGARAGDIASHLLLTDPAGEPWVVDQLELAARVVAAEGAPEMALPLLMRARAEPPPADRRRDLTLAAARSAAIGTPQVAAPLLREAFADADTAERRLEVAALMRGVSAVQTELDVSAAVEFSAAVAEESEDPVVRLRAIAAVAQLGLITDGVTAATPAVEQLIELARLDDPALPDDVLAVRTLAGVLRNDPVAELARAGRLALDRHLGEHPGRWPTWAFHAAYPIFLANGPDALRLLDDCLLAQQAGGFVIVEAIVRMFRSWWALPGGGLAACDLDARLSLDALVLSGVKVYQPGALAALVDVLLVRGELDEAQSQLVRYGLDAGPLTGPSTYLTCLLFRRARLRRAQGRLPEAVADLRACGSRLCAGWHQTSALMPWRSELATTLHATGGDSEEVSRLAHEELRLATAFGAVGGLAIARRAVAAVTDDLELALRAVADFEAAGNRLGLAGGLIDLGVMQRRRGDPAARERLLAGLDLAESMGAVVEVKRARAELALAGVKPHRNRTTGVDALTPAELRTATLAAAGATNRNIAQTSFLSIKTVETQLNAAYRKLDCGGRSGLAQALEGV